MVTRLAVTMVEYLVLWMESPRGLEMALDWVDRLVLSMEVCLVLSTEPWRDLQMAEG